MKSFINVILTKFLKNMRNNMCNKIIKSKIFSVIKSCITLEQLENTINWASNISKRIPYSLEELTTFMKLIKDKKQQIQNGLAAKYN